MGHIIAVVGGKGGVGKSVFAANLAIAYQLNSKQRSLIVDLDFQSLGDQNIILGMNPPKNIVDLSKTQVPQWDPKTLAPFMMNAPQGFSFIGSPREAAVARDIDLDGLGKFLKAAAQIFPLVVVDCGNGTEPHALKALEQATAIFVVTTPDVIVINQTRRILAKVQELLFPPEMIQVIVNRFSPTNVINPQMIQKNLGKTPFFAIPDEAATCENSLSKSQPFTLANPGAPISRAFSDLVRRIDQTKMLDQLAKLNKPSGTSAKFQAANGAGPAAAPTGEGAAGMFTRSKVGATDPWTNMKLRIHKGLIDIVDMKRMNSDMNDPKQREVLREKTQKAILDVLAKEDITQLCPTREARAQLVKEVLDEALGLGPLEDLLADETVTEIMVNARDQIYIEQNGRAGLSKTTFSSEQQMMNVVERIVTPLGRRCDEKTPYVDARLPDGSRVHIIIPPLALRGPTITIRKFPKKRIVSADLVKFGSMTQEIADFLRACVEAKMNIVVSGGTGSGKTTLLNVLSNFIPTNERIITVEDAAELQLGQDHVVRLETRPKNIEGEGEVAIRDLIKCCLRMRPDRIVVGECRGGEAMDMLQAMNTGHSGSLTTVHSNNPRECIGRLETLVMMAGMGLPLKAIRETIASSVNVIVQQSRLIDGSRKITHISEVIGMQGETVTIQDIFIYKQEGLDKNRKIVGRFVPTGFIPKFVEEMEMKGMKISRGLFAVK
jgi:pilus assembly protein CpaF